MPNLEKVAAIANEKVEIVHKTDGDILSIFKKNEKELLTFNQEEIIDIDKEKLQVLSIWEEFVKINKLQNKILGFPIWLDFFGFNYKDNEKFRNSTKEFDGFKSWKKKFWEQNRSFYNNNRKKCYEWWKKWERVLKKQKTYRKFEWNGGKKLKSIREGIVQFRNSGVRVRRANFFPALVKNQSLPIVWDKKEESYRYLRINETLFLQSFSPNLKFPEISNKKKIFGYIGNSINVELLKFFLQENKEVFVSILTKERKLKNNFKFVDLFSGIGGFHQAIKQFFPESECIAAVEKDSFCKDTYLLNYEVKNFYNDITDEEGTQIHLTSPNVEYDLITAGFPCTPFSKAGKMMGSNHPEGKLFDSVVKIIRDYNDSHKTPIKLVILENVTYLVNHNKKATWEKMREDLRKENYEIFKQGIYNPLDLGILQNRSRLFVGFIHNDFKKSKE